MALVGRRFVMACKFTHFFSFGQKTSLCRFRFFVYADSDNSRSIKDNRGIRQAW